MARVDALCSMHRFEAALPVVEDLLRIDPKNRDALTRKGLVLARLGRVNDAKVHMQQVAEGLQGRHRSARASSAASTRISGAWNGKTARRCRSGSRLRSRPPTTSPAPITIYDKAARRKFDFYTGINVVSFVKLLAHLKADHRRGAR